MSNINLPIVNDNGDTEMMLFDRSQMDPGDLATADSFMDTAEYALNNDDHPGRRTDHDLNDFEGTTIDYNGQTFYLQTSQDIIEDMAANGEFDPTEDHSL